MSDMSKDSFHQNSMDPIEAPPEYTPSATDSTAPASFQGEPPEFVYGPPSSAFPEVPLPPSDVQRAQPPLKVVTTNSRITADYLLVNIADAKSAPDTLLKTTNGKITTSVWVEDRVKRPVTIEAVTTNGTVGLAVITMVPEQEVDITASSTNAPVRVALPPHFHGLLTLSTTHGKRLLSPLLQAKSVQISLPDETDNRTVAYEIGGPHGLHVARLKTTNGTVAAGLLGEESVTAAEGKDKGCVVM